MSSPRLFDSACMQGRKVLITAGASGLGLEMAKLFSATGAQVFICDIDEGALEQARAQLPQVGAMVADVSDEDSVAHLFDQAKAHLGGLDVLINNAGVAGPTGYVETLS